MLREVPSLFQESERTAGWAAVYRNKGFKVTALAGGLHREGAGRKARAKCHLPSAFAHLVRPPRGCVHLPSAISAPAHRWFLKAKSKVLFDLRLKRELKPREAF